MSDSRSVVVQGCLDRLKHGDDSARRELLAHAAGRLEHLTRAMLHSFARLRRWEQTDDVMQNALIRLDRALRSAPPESPLQFFRLAALQIRRELIDLSRHHYGPQGPARAHHTDGGDGSQPPAYERPDPEADPSQLAVWTEFHERADALPEVEREAFDLVWYQGLSYPEAAEALGVSPRTVMRHYQAARLRLHDAVGGRLTGT